MLAQPRHIALDPRPVFWQTAAPHWRPVTKTRGKSAMNPITRIGYVCALALFGVLFLAGCNQNASTDAAAATRAPQSGANPSTDAVARAAADFLDAVLKGDSQRASARLTPQAIQRINDSGMPFAPPGMATATFRIGEVRAPSQDQAVVQCVLTDTATTEGPQDEEICCLMRRVENDWRVSGIAYGTAANQPWTLSNFETGQSSSIPRQPSIERPAKLSTTPSGVRPSPARTAQEPSTATVR